MELLASWASYRIIKTYPKGRKDTRLAAWCIMLTFPLGVLLSEVAQNFDAATYALVLWLIGLPFLIMGMVTNEAKRFPK